MCFLGYSASRASKSLNEDVPSKAHELILATAWCDQASVRIQKNLKSLLDRKDLQLDNSMDSIAKDVLEHGSTVPDHPLKV